jgi:protein-tyrosine phosphatase
LIESSTSKTVEALISGVSHQRRTTVAVVFAALAVAIAFTASRADANPGQAVSGWIAANVLALSIAYFRNWPGVFGKSEAGPLRWPLVLLMAPVLLFIRVVWQLQNLVFRTPLCNEIAPDLFVGRLCGYESLPKGVSVVVDLTAEFRTPHSLLKNVRTIRLPTLDGCPPDWAKCQQVFELLQNEPHRIYVCCANGHGRSVTLMAAWLGQLGMCHSAAEAVRIIQAARPTAAPNFDQMSFLTHVFQIMKTNRGRPRSPEPG